jgi:Phage integrase family
MLGGGTSSGLRETVLLDGKRLGFSVYFFNKGFPFILPDWTDFRLRTYFAQSSLDVGAFAVVDRWLDVRKKKGINGRAPLFCTLQGQPIKSAYVRALLLRQPARKAGIEKRVHAHGLRHTHAAQLAPEGVPLNVIQAQDTRTAPALGQTYCCGPQKPLLLRPRSLRRCQGWLGLC